jgi:hypothetical protein
LVREKSLASGGSHGVRYFSDAAFLLGGDIEVHPLPLLGGDLSYVAHLCSRVSFSISRRYVILETRVCR